MFHQLLDAEKYEELYELTDERARATKSKQRFRDILLQVRTHFGKLKYGSTVDIAVLQRDGFREVNLAYSAEFENGTQPESFVWYVIDGKARLFSYQIQV